MKARPGGGGGTTPVTTASVQQTESTCGVKTKGELTENFVLAGDVELPRPSFVYQMQPVQQGERSADPERAAAIVRLVGPALESDSLKP